MMTRVKFWIILFLFGAASSRVDAAIYFNLNPQPGVSLAGIGLGQTFNLTITATLTTSSDYISIFGAAADFGGPAFRVNSITAGDLVSSSATFSTSSSSTSFYLKLTSPNPITTSGTIANISLTALQPFTGQFNNYYREFSGAAVTTLTFSGFDSRFNIVPTPSSLILTILAAPYAIAKYRPIRRAPLGPK